MKKTKTLPKPLLPWDLLPIGEILDHFGVAPGGWDVLIIGDGSGTTWGSSIGWASVLVDRATQLRKEFHGGMNAGTSYLAELMPYVHALSWYVEGPGRPALRDKLVSNPAAKIRIHVISDNELVSKQGSGMAKRGVGSYYWAMFEEIESLGFECHWHWMERNKIGLNKLCDHLAGMCRVSIDQVVSVVPTPGCGAYEFNPPPKG